MKVAEINHPYAPCPRDAISGPFKMGRARWAVRLRGEGSASAAATAVPTAVQTPLRGSLI